MVKAALLSSTNPSHQFRVYFERNQKELCRGGDDLDDYTVIIGTELNVLTESKRKNGVRMSNINILPQILPAFFLAVFYS